MTLPETVEARRAGAFLGAQGRAAQGGSADPPELAPAVAGRRGSWESLRAVLGSRGRLAGFLVGAAVVALGYTILLPFDDTQRLELANWSYLTPALGLWAVLLGCALSLVVSIQVYATRLVIAARRGPGSAGRGPEASTELSGGAAAGTLASVGAFVASLLPSFLCCTPIIPTLLAFVGVTGVGLYDATGTLQHFFAVHQVEFLAGTLALLVLTGWWGLRKVATASCLDGCCDLSERSCPEPASAGIGETAGRAVPAPLGDASSGDAR